MAFNRINPKLYDIKFIAGDTEYFRLNVKDENGVVIEMSNDSSVIMAIKRHRGDEVPIIPETIATLYTYDADTQKYTIEFMFTSSDTLSILNYDGKRRNNLKCVYDVELHDVRQGVDEVTTLVSGNLQVARSISGTI